MVLPYLSRASTGTPLRDGRGRDEDGVGAARAARGGTMACSLHARRLKHGYRLANDEKINENTAIFNKTQFTKNQAIFTRLTMKLRMTDDWLCCILDGLCSKRYNGLSAGKLDRREAAA